MGKWTRRAFLLGGALSGGGLVLAVAVRPGHRTPRLAKLVQGENEVLVNAWVKLLPNNEIKVIVPHVEMGQGAHTAMAMMLAEELDADWSKVSVEEAPAHEEYATYDIARDFVYPAQVPGFVDDTIKGAFLEISQIMDLQITGGSYSVRATGVRSMRVAGAAVRELLINAAADVWGVAASEVRTEDSFLFHDGSGKKAAYIEFAQQAAKEKGSNTPTLKSESEFKIMGRRDIQRLDIPAKVTGEAQFGIDVALPGMKVATVRAAPVFGATVESVDSQAVQKLDAVHRVLNLGDAVAVVAEGYWQAKKALAQLEIVFSKTDNDSLSSVEITQGFKQDLDKAVEDGQEIEDFSEGDVSLAFGASTKIIEAEYSVPFLAHATMEPMNCTALFRDGLLEVWTGTQNPLGVRNSLAKEFSIDANNVIVNNQYLGGGFGRRADIDYSLQAAKIAIELPDTPIKLIWSREEDTQHDHYRQAMVSRFKGGFDSNGAVVAWDNQFHEKHEPVEAPYIPYDIPNQSIHYTNSATHVPFGPWRSVDHSVHAFFTESFIDELAHAAGEDGYHFRRGLLGREKRMISVLDTAAKMANWNEALPAGWGRGIAIHRSFNTIVAQVVEVNMTGSSLRVEKVFCAADAGYAVSPDGFKAQMESGIVFGLTAALFGEITIKSGAVVQSNFHDYPMIRMKDSPLIEVEIINSGEALGGGGEPGTPPIAPAVTNAIFAASGTRVRALPIKI
ncbi:xanthine dehydrogenase family protein molybdopterin-binding subunit [Arenicella sp. 4NH20-0111]|uniref:xanthine dehydrogenase family protein molybdopterin-binding subunit n=1 Tax=Arenicella sp. 4NH20-0111 TaxID=3127648 RepID=UPI00310C672D